MNIKPEVCILLATYNGERFLSEQIKSIQNQSYKNWKLLIRDDSSDDNTLNIVEKFCHLDPRISLVSDNKINSNRACGNFSLLMKAARDTSSQIFMCCDQDDFWLPHKIELQVSKFQTSAIKSKQPSPLLVHSDLEVVDDDLKQIAPSFIQYMALKPETDKTLVSLFTQNMVTGCTMAFNRALLEISTPIPNTAIMHDWWLAMVCARNGKVIYIPECLVKYRQHATNTIGAQSYWRSVSAVHHWFHRWQQGNRYFYRTLAQAKKFSEFSQPQQSNINDEANQHLLEFINILNKSRLSRLKSMYQLKLGQANWLTNFVLAVRLLFLPSMR